MYGIIFYVRLFYQEGLLGVFGIKMVKGKFEIAP